MQDSTRQRILYFILVLLYVLHNDLWLWNDPSLLAGLPVGLVYHITFCVAVSLLMQGLVSYAWPSQVSNDPVDEDPIANEKAA